MELWHNPRCSKSRGVKELLEARGIAFTERRYVEDPPTVAELDRVLRALGKEPWEVFRSGEPVASALGLAAMPYDRTRWLEVLVANPILIERPILITDDGRAALGRPPEHVLPLLPD
jgi:arsenate reductase